MAPKSIDFIKGVGSAMSPDGEAAQLKFSRGSGSIVNIDFQTANIAALMQAIEVEMIKLSRNHNRVLKTQHAAGRIKPRHDASFTGVLAEDGTPVLQVVLSSGLHLDFAIRQDGIGALIEWLELLDKGIRANKPPLN